MVKVMATHDSLQFFGIRRQVEKVRHSLRISVSKTSILLLLRLNIFYSAVLKIQCVSPILSFGTFPNFSSRQI